jgi:hypothetical protein
MIIMVYGFPHSGTTILRKLIGEHSHVYDFLNEVEDPPISKGNLVFKIPMLPDDRHAECKRIMIMKNPYDIYGSFYLRFGEKYLTYPGRTIGNYEQFVRHFLTTKDFTVKYEELASRLPEVFEYLGLEYEGIKNLTSYISYKHKYIPEEKPTLQTEGDDHAYYRQWQINQPFTDMTGQSAKHLPEFGRELINKSEIIKQLYD